MAGEEVKLPIAIPVDTNAAAAASEVESLRDRISAGTDAIRAMSGTMRQLRGTSDEVKAAKAKLKAQIDATKDSVSAASLSLVKNGTTYDAVSQKSKKLAAEQKKLSDEMKASSAKQAAAQHASLSAVVSKAGGPLASLRDKWKSMSEVLGGAGGAMGVTKLAALGLVGAILAVAAAAVGAGIALGKFILNSANAARSANLAREAWAGTAKNATNLGTQVDALSAKLPTSKAALNELAISLMKTKLGGQATVDTFNAVAQASSALGDEAGNKLKEFVERGRMVGRLRISPTEMLEGFGALNFEDITAELAKGTHKSVAAARAELMLGATKLGDGAAAIRSAVEKKFGDLNLRKMMDLNVMVEKFHERVAALTKDIHLEPLLKQVAKFGSLFDESTVTGKTLQSLVTAFGTGMVGALQKGIPLVKSFMQGLIIGALRSYIAFLQLRNAFRSTFGDSATLKNIDTIKVALIAGQFAAGAMAASLGAIVASAALIGVAAGPILKAWQPILNIFTGVKAALSEGWEATGRALVKGLIAGIKAEVSAVKNQVTGLAKVIKATFSSDMKIQSPSKVFEQYGKNTTQGYAKGVRESSGDAADATRSLGVAPVAAAPRGAGPISITVNISAGGGGGAAKELSSDTFLAQLTKALEDALVGAGIPVQA